MGLGVSHQRWDNDITCLNHSCVLQGKMQNKLRKCINHFVTLTLW